MGLAARKLDNTRTTEVNNRQPKGQRFLFNTHHHRQLLAPCDDHQSKFSITLLGHNHSHSVQSPPRLQKVRANRASPPDGDAAMGVVTGSTGGVIPATIGIFPTGVSCGFPPGVPTEVPEDEICCGLWRMWYSCRCACRSANSTFRAAGHDCEISTRCCFSQLTLHCLKIS